MKQSQALLREAGPGFRVLVDLRRARPFPEDGLVYWDVGVNLYRRRGMIDSLVLLPGGRAARMDELVGRKAG